MSDEEDADMAKTQRQMSAHSSYSCVRVFCVYLQA